MDRRMFVASLGASLLIPLAMRQATPFASPAQTGRPAPIDLGSGITLIDYRLHPGDYLAIIGELRNDTDRMIDAPVISLYYSRQGQDEGFTWVSPVLPVIEAGGSVPMFGILPDETAPEAILASARFALCSPAEPGEFTKQQQAMADAIVVTVTEEEGEATRYYAQGTIENTGATPLRQVVVRGVVRDSNGRIAGTTGMAHWPTLEAGQTRQYTVWARPRNKANPFVLLTDTNYSVEIIGGVRGPAIAPGCSSGRPWD